MNSDVTLAKNAAAGNKTDRAKVTQLAYPLITTKTEKLCKHYCLENRTRYKCTLDNKWGSQSTNAPLCEWGNGSVAWMLDDLTNKNRLNKFEGRKNASLINYLSKIASSHQFRERWKDWRRRRRIRVPDYVKVLDKDADKIFWKLCDQDSVPNIAQRLGRSPTDIDNIVKQIYTELHARKKMHQLSLPQLISLTAPATSDEQHTQLDLASGEADNDEKLYRQQIKSAFSQLSWQEQFILEAIIIDELDARSVLAALIEQDISIKPGVTPEKTSINHIYYFRNKTLTKLKNLFDLNA